ncbi:MAG: hypothetical protein M3541_11380 [Acidobacteriota bacterium]|nr:hypothetical protein [Acidobacteriota bacterium]
MPFEPRHKSRLQWSLLHRTGSYCYPALSADLCDPAISGLDSNQFLGGQRFTLEFRRHAHDFEQSDVSLKLRRQLSQGPEASVLIEKVGHGEATSI